MHYVLYRYNLEWEFVIMLTLKKWEKYCYKVSLTIIFIIHFLGKYDLVICYKRNKFYDLNNDHFLQNWDARINMTNY